MSDDPAKCAAMKQAVDVEEWDRVEELWLEALESVPIPTEELLQVHRELLEAGKKSLAHTQIELLAESLEAAGDAAGMMATLRELVGMTPKPDSQLLQRLEEAFAQARSGSPSLAKVRDRYQLTTIRKPLQQLAIMEGWLDHDVGTAVEVMGQGVGRVVDLNLELDNIKVDIGGRRPVSVPFGAASRYLRRLPDGDFLRRKVEEPGHLAELVAAEPGEILVQLLDSIDTPAEVAAIKAALDGLLPPTRWNTWWTKARKHPRVLTSGSGSRLRYAVSHTAESATDTLVSELEEAQPRERLTVARRLGARGDEPAEAAASFLAETLTSLEQSDPGLAWETAALLAGLPGGSRPAEACQQRLITSVAPRQLLTSIQDRAARQEVLQTLRRTAPEDWAKIWAEWLSREDHAALLTIIAATLDEEDETDLLEAALETVFRNPLEHPQQLLWACELMTEEHAPAVLRRRMTPSLLEILPETITRKEFSAARGRAKALLDGGKVAVRLLLEAASEQQAERFLQRVQRLDSLEPDRLRLIEQAAQQARTTDREEEEPMLVATQGAVDGKRAELKQLLDVEIPKTLKGINAAAAEGDLRENFEYHMLRDRQELQSARAAQLQRELAQVRIIEPGSADSSQVNIGTVVSLQDLSGNPIEPITILGPWDADVKQRVFASGTELAQGLFGHKVGDTVEVGGAKAKITAIESY